MRRWTPVSLIACGALLVVAIWSMTGRSSDQASVDSIESQSGAKQDGGAEEESDSSALEKLTTPEVPVVTNTRKGLGDFDPEEKEGKTIPVELEKRLSSWAKQKLEYYDEPYEAFLSFEKASHQWIQYLEGSLAYRLESLLDEEARAYDEKAAREVLFSHIIHRAQNTGQEELGRALDVLRRLCGEYLAKRAEMDAKYSLGRAGGSFTDKTVFSEEQLKKAKELDRWASHAYGPFEQDLQRILGIPEDGGSYLVAW